MSSVCSGFTEVRDSQNSGREESSLALGCQKAGVQRQDKWMQRSVPRKEGTCLRPHHSDSLNKNSGPAIPELCSFLHTERQRRWGKTESRGPLRRKAPPAAMALGTLVRFPGDCGDIPGHSFPRESLAFAFGRKAQALIWGGLRSTPGGRDSS